MDGRSLGVDGWEISRSGWIRTLSSLSRSRWIRTLLSRRGRIKSLKEWTDKISQGVDGQHLSRSGWIKSLKE
jgi:hypothetical protein